MQTESAGPGTHDLSPMMECSVFLKTDLCVRLIDLNQKNKVLVSLMEVLSKRQTWEGAGRQWITWAVEEVLSGTYICL